MKKNLFLALAFALLSYYQTFAQSTEIRPGNILPTMTTAQRNAIATPLDGMLVFDSNTQSYWFRQGGTWVTLAGGGGGTNYWALNGLGGNEIKNTNPGGLWSANPVGLTFNSDDISNPPTAPVSGVGTRMMWIPSRSAFRVGTVNGSNWDANNIGLFSFASGYNTKASGTFSTSIGLAATASGYGSIALGNSTASGDQSTAMGSTTRAIGTFSTAMGNVTTASGEGSTALGIASTASSYGSTALGIASTASGYGSTVMGRETTASSLYATSMGFQTHASGDYSTAMGNNSRAFGEHSIAMGKETIANGFSSTAIGYASRAYGSVSTAIGNGVYASGVNSTAMGYQTYAFGFCSTAMGFGTTASGFYSTAIGINNIDNPNGLFMVGNGSSFTPHTAFIIRKDNNRVGIGVEDPIAPLHVAGLNNIYNLVSNGVYFGNNGIFYPYTLPTPVPLANKSAIFADGTIISNNAIGSYLTVVSSDSRIKKDFSLSNNSEDLERLSKIQITNYRMKDMATWGDKTFKKVIAQQVEEVYPEVINKTKSVIPDIYALAESVAYDATSKNLSVTLSKDYTIKVGEKLELVHPEKGKIQAEVVAVNGKTFTVKDWNYATDKIFVFGREVNDFRSVDYEALSMLGISAIQQLAKENEELRITIDELRASSEELRISNYELRASIEELRISNYELRASKVKTEARLEAIENLLKTNLPTGK
jgi:hypothetical protein